MAMWPGTLKLWSTQLVVVALLPATSRNRAVGAKMYGVVDLHLGEKTRQ